MACGVTWECDVCGYQIAIRRFQEYFIDDNGLRKRGSHFETRPEAINAKIRGFSAILYCTHCEDLRDIIMTTRYAEGIERQEIDEVCNKCGNKLTDNLGGRICPKCGTGTFKVFWRWTN